MEVLLFDWPFELRYTVDMKKILKIYEFPTIIEKDAVGYFFAYVPSLQGCYTQGKTLEEALHNIREVIELHIQDRRELSEVIPRRKPVSIASIEVMA